LLVALKWLIFTSILTYVSHCELAFSFILTIAPFPLGPAPRGTAASAWTMRYSSPSFSACAIRIRESRNARIDSPAPNVNPTMP